MLLSFRRRSLGSSDSASPSSPQSIAHPIRRAVAMVIEELEQRIQFNSTFVTLPLAQNWSNTNLITADNDWSNVPGITGYTGAVAGSMSDVDPQTITADLVTGAPQQVISNQSTPASATGNGVAEFEQVTDPDGTTIDPTVALKGSSSSDSPFLLFDVNTTGVSSVQMSYNLRDIDTSDNSDPSQCALQYRTTTSGTWTNIPAGYVADATPGTGATAVTPVNVTLPAACSNLAQLQLRVIANNINGPDEWFGVDDINIAAGGNGALAFANATQSVTEGTPYTTVSVTRSNGATGAVTVNYATSDGTANAGSRYTATSGTLSFAAGQTTASFNVPIIDDSIVENPETFNVTLSSPTGGATLGTQTTDTVTIYDNDGHAPAVLLNELDVNPPGSDDGAEYAEFKGPASSNLNNVYFVSLQGDTTKGAGDANLVVPLSGDSLGSNGLLLLDSSAGIVSSGDPATTVVNNSAFDSSALNNNANSFALIYSQTPLTQGTDLDPTDSGTLSLPSGATLMDGVGWQAAGATGAVLYGAQLTQSSGTPDAATRFPTNTTANSAAAWYNGDLLGTVPSSRTYDTSQASADIPAGAVLTPGAANYAGSGTSNGELGFSDSTYSVSESGGVATITVNRTAGLNGAVTVNYSATAGTATNGGDFTAVSGTLNFADGQTSTTFTVPIIDDTVLDPARTINLSLTTPTGGAITGPISTATLTINDNDVLLNEIKVNPPGSTDNPHEWVEIRATPGLTLNYIYFVGIEGDIASNPGTVNEDINLTGVTVGSAGLVILEAPDNTDFTVPAGVTVVKNSDFDQAGGALQNDAQSFALIYSPTNPINETEDLDTNDDGTLDLPSGAVVLDGVGWQEQDTANVGTFSGISYFTALTQSSGTPDAATRFANDTDPISKYAWYNADLVDTGNDPTQLVYDQTRGSTNLPANAVMTPGTTNFGTKPTTAPTLTASEFDYTGITAQQIKLTFSESVIDTFSTNDFTLVNRTAGNTIVPASAFTITEISPGVITLTFPGNTDAALADGRYQLLIKHADIKDTSGNLLNQDYTFNFFSLTGDANHDGTVNALDFNALATNYGKAGTFAQGDFDYSGMIGSNDFALLAARYGTVLAPVSSSDPVLESLPASSLPASSLTAAQPASLFSNTPLNLWSSISD